MDIKLVFRPTCNPHRGGLMSGTIASYRSPNEVIGVGLYESVASTLSIGTTNRGGGIERIVKPRYL